MIVDDEPANCDLLRQALGQKYETLVVFSGAECLEQLPRFKPDIILLDILMPEMTGYEVCENIRRDEHNDVSIVFISALDTLDDRLACYDAGGDDYMRKPVDLAILFKKLELLIRSRENNEALNRDIKEAQQAFMAAMQMGAEGGITSSFIEKSFLTKTYDGLLAAFFESMREFNLKTAAQIRYEEQTITVNSDGRHLDVEQELIARAQYDGRILEFGKRMFINYEHFSILIKNAPTDNQDLYGRLKDHLAIIASACDARIKSIGNEINLKKHLNLSSLFKTTLSAVENIQHTIEQDFQATLSITQKMGQSIEERVLHLGLDEDQERLLMDIIDESTEQLINKMANKNSIQESFEEVLEGMNKALKYF